MEWINVSGNIYAQPDRFSTDGFTYVIRPNSQGWGLPTENIEPEDLRVLADELEKYRKEKQNG